MCRSVPRPVLWIRWTLIFFPSSDESTSARTGRCLPHSRKGVPSSLEIRAVSPTVAGLTSHPGLPHRGPGWASPEVRSVRTSRHPITENSNYRAHAELPKHREFFGREMGLHSWRPDGKFIDGRITISRSGRESRSLISFAHFRSASFVFRRPH
jgi:hypothetical protein